MSRNLAQYPITVEEVVETLEVASALSWDPMAVGGQQSAIMDAVVRVIKREFRHDDFNP